MTVSSQHVFIETLLLPFCDTDGDHEGSDASDKVHGPEQAEGQEPKLLSSLKRKL